jgi:hypothetical protein
MRVALSEDGLAQALIKGVPNINLLELATPAVAPRAIAERPIDGLARRHTTVPSRYRSRRPVSFAEPPAGRDVYSPRGSRPRFVDATSEIGHIGPALSGTHEWVEKRMSRLMSDDFLRR